jgi:hypothetical protein
LGEGMDFQAKEWSFLLRNGLIEHIGCKAGAMAFSTHRKESTFTVYQRSEWYVVILTNQLKYITVNVVRQENLDFMRV